MLAHGYTFTAGCSAGDRSSHRSRLVLARQGPESNSTRTAAPKVDEAPKPAAEAPKPAAEAPKERKLSPLAKGGTLQGAAALGKDASAATKASTGPGGSTQLAMVDGKFVDDRWINGNWDESQFKMADGKTDWDAMIDAEMARRKLLEESPIASTNEDPVVFDTEQIPWWAWVRRFHLPQAELLNGRACMVGYFIALIVDGLGGAGLWDQQDSFLGKLLLHITVFAVLIVRSPGDLAKYRGLIDEATFYDKQW